MAKTTGFSGNIGDTDIRLLKIFRSVVESNGFSTAQIELNISVSAISIAIGDLEKRLGMKLCLRGRAGFSLTEEGRDVYQAILQLMTSLENFRAEVNGISSQLKGELNIGITDNLVTMYKHMRITNSLATLKRLGPDVQINIRMQPPLDIEKNILDGRLHVGVIPSLKPVAGLQYRRLYGEQCNLYCSHLHPLFKPSSTQLTAQDVLAHDAVILTRGVAESGRVFMQKMRPAATASDREGIAFLILSGEYIGFLPDHYAQRWVNEGRMCALQTEHFSYVTDYSAITRKGGRPNLVLETYLEELGKSENDRPGF